MILYLDDLVYIMKKLPNPMRYSPEASYIDVFLNPRVQVRAMWEDNPTLQAIDIARFLLVEDGPGKRRWEYRGTVIMGERP